MRLSAFFVYPLWVALLAIAPAVAQAQPRPSLPIALVSVQRILNEADDAKAGAKELEALRTAKTQELNARKQALDATRLALANAGGYFSSSRRAQLVDTAKRQETEFQQATQQAQTELQEVQRKLQDRLRGELGTIVSAIAIQRGFLYVLNQDVALIAPAAANVTDEVLARLNAASAQREANAKAAAAANAAKN